MPGMEWHEGDMISKAFLIGWALQLWAKATELAKVPWRDGQRFDCATWLHKARELPKKEFKREALARPSEHVRDCSPGQNKLERRF
jgi:hypothetical protein